MDITWNEGVSHPIQSYEWAQAMKAYGSTIIPVSIFDADGSTQNFLITTDKLPYVTHLRGSLFMCHKLDKQALGLLIQTTKTHNLAYLRYEPYAFKSSDTEMLSNHSGQASIANKVHAPLKRSFYEWTRVLDIKSDLEEVFQSFSKACRYSIRQAEKKGVTTEVHTDAGHFETFFNLYQTTAERQGYGIHDKNYYESIWEHLKTSMAFIVTAYFESKPVATSMFLYFKDRMYYLYAGNQYEYRNLNASNLIILEAIKYGKSLGMREFDLWGVMPPSSTEESAWAGFSKYKASFGGELQELEPGYDIVNKRMIYSLLDLRQRLKK